MTEWLVYAYFYTNGFCSDQQVCRIQLWNTSYEEVKGIALKAEIQFLIQSPEKELLYWMLANQDNITDCPFSDSSSSILCPVKFFLPLLLFSLSQLMNRNKCKMQTPSFDSPLPGDDYFAFGFECDRTKSSSTISFVPSESFLFLLLSIDFCNWS